VLWNIVVDNVSSTIRCGISFVFFEASTYGVAWYAGDKTFYLPLQREIPRVLLVTVLAMDSLFFD
jgi:hypothetical protein